MMRAEMVASLWSKPCTPLGAISISQTRYEQTHTQTDKQEKTLSAFITDNGYKYMYHNTYVLMY